MLRASIVLALVQVATSLTINGVPARNHPDATVVENGVVVKEKGKDLKGRPITKPSVPGKSVVDIGPGESVVQVNSHGKPSSVTQVGSSNVYVASAKKYRPGPPGFCQKKDKPCTEKHRCCKDLACAVVCYGDVCGNYCAPEDPLKDKCSAVGELCKAVPWPCCKGLKCVADWPLHKCVPSTPRKPPCKKCGTVPLGRAVPAKSQFRLVAPPLVINQGGQQIVQKPNGDITVNQG